MDLPFKAEYAKSSRSSCRGCKRNIEQESLRLAVMVQAHNFDGKQAMWYHHTCFFTKQRPKSVDEIEKFQSLRVEHQDYITKQIENRNAAIVPDKKGKKRDAKAASAKNAALKDFKMEYAKSGRAMCRGCEQKILQGEIRISKKDFTTEIGAKYGGQDMWHHLTCFAQIRSELGYFESADKLPGFNTLSKDDQKEAKKQLPAVKQEDVPDIKKVKKEEDTVDSLSEEDNKKFREQNKVMYKYRDQLKEQLKKPQLIELLEFNSQAVPVGIDEILDRLADIMTFGALSPCSVCKSGQLVFKGHSYVCEGDLTEWTKCKTVAENPERIPFKVPKSLKVDDYPVLKKYKYIARTRIVKPSPKNLNSDITKKEEEGANEPKVKRAAPPLYEMEFVILGKPTRGKDVLKKQIQSLGGKVVTKLSKSVMAVIASSSEVENMGSRMREAKDEGIHVVPEDFVDEAKKNAGKIPELVITKSICDWGSDPHTRMPPEQSQSGVSTLKSKSGSRYVKSLPSKIKLTVKQGAAVDPDSGLEDIAHVYSSGSDKWTAILGRTDIVAQKNSFYKLQLLESDNHNCFWIFRSWGRIGTTIGGNKTEKMSYLEDAKQEFRRLYEEKSGNKWEDRKNFKKIPGCMYPIDVDYSADEVDSKLEITDAPSKLAKPVQDLIHLIFDVNSMKKVMAEFELDTEKMPLGKLSKSQVQQAFAVLSELQILIDNKDTHLGKFVDATNRFYTLVPHSFGIDMPPIINHPEVIKQKLDMLDSLMELEIAYTLMKSSGSEHTVDSYYHQLKTDIDVLDKDSSEFKLLEEYVKNTHAETHSSYELVIEDIYTVKRHGEDKRYKPFKKLPNRKLLWHGSRTTNFAGILSQGLRIAPPEAPVTGYMFGKGIYFADMVSKSANYCCTNPSNPTGLLLLCEVALGDMYERTRADYIEKLPKGKHSTKGVGITQPDPSASKMTKDGVEIPLGKSVSSNSKNSALLYNEYIVYDVAQVNVKYLLKMHFKYKY